MKQQPILLNELEIIYNKKLHHALINHARYLLNLFKKTLNPAQKSLLKLKQWL